MFWDLIITICLLISCILTPFNLAFTDELEEVYWYVIFNYMIDLFFAIDIFINFNTAIVDDEF